MKNYWFVPNNNVPEESSFYFIFEEKIKNYNCISLKDLKEFSKKYPNIILYKENIENDIKDLETKKYLENNFDLKKLYNYLK